MPRSGVHLPVCPVCFLTLIGRAAHTQRDSPGRAACDAASVQFGPMIRLTDILVFACIIIPLSANRVSLDGIEQLVSSICPSVHPSLCPSVCFHSIL